MSRVDREVMMSAGDDATIRVAESVYKAGEAFDALVYGDGFLLAEPMVTWFRGKKGRKKEADFWKAIWDYLREKEFSAMGTAIVVAPDADFKGTGRRASGKRGPKIVSSGRVRR